jgi:hypothetical protein
VYYGGSSSVRCALLSGLLGLLAFSSPPLAAQQPPAITYWTGFSGIGMAGDGQRDMYTVQAPSSPTGDTSVLIKVGPQGQRAFQVNVPGYASAADQAGNAYVVAAELPGLS